jgi:hypothetical protein
MASWVDKLAYCVPIAFECEHAFLFVVLCSAFHSTHSISLLPPALTLVLSAIHITPSSREFLTTSDASRA